MFNHSSHIAISHGNFNVIHGNLYNNNLEPGARTPFSPADEWMKELYQEYRRVRKGEINLLRTICEMPVMRYEYEKRQLGKGEAYDDFKATRVFTVVRLDNGPIIEDESVSLGVVYTGRDSKKVFKQDCIDFSRITHASFVQLRAFNDSNNPILLFQDELIPVAHVVENHLHCRQALLRYLFFQMDAIPTDSSFPFNLSSKNLWIRPQDGQLIISPDGPPIKYWSVILHRLRPQVSAQQRPIPVLSMNQYNDRHLLSYLADRVFLNGFRPQELDGNLCFDPQSLSSDTYLALLSRYISSRKIIAGFPELGCKVPWLEMRQDWPNQVLMYDGRRRFQVTRPHDLIKPCFIFALDESYRQKLSFIWLTQACHIFGRLNIPQDDWVDYGYLSMVSLNLTPVRMPTTQTSVSPSTEEVHDRFDLPCYLFIYSFSRFSNGFPDLSWWLSGTDVYYWSFDPNGHTVMKEWERVAFGLHCYVPKAMAMKHTWSLGPYDFMRRLQAAKGFDASTTDYARSIGLPILEIIPQPEDQARIDSNFCSPSPIMISDASREGGVVEDMDIDVEDCCSRVEHLAVGVGMEVDDQ